MRTPGTLYLADIRDNYREWRRAMVAAIRNERRVGLVPVRGANTDTRAWRAYQLRQRRRLFGAA